MIFRQKLELHFIMIFPEVFKPFHSLSLQGQLLMFPEFLKYGYLGLLALSVMLFFRIINNSIKSQQSIKSAWPFLAFFSIFYLLSGIVGFIWASKELEIADKKETTASILSKQINQLNSEHLQSMRPLNSALEGAVEKYNYSVIESTRNQYINEIKQINQVMSEREKVYSERIFNLKNTFNDVVETDAK
ncbi:hypothetical protein WKI40_10275 [Kosakonia sacchari]|uniref:hypothetical protein n=1 Tax=Kosakonia sacchari TaxID=1158459 RepID=UPI0030C2853A